MNEPHQELEPLWPARPKVVLLGTNDPRVQQNLPRLRSAISSQAEIVHEDFSFANDLSHLEADLVVVCGGDGSILRSARQMGERQWPVAGVNLGTIGFLADLSIDEFDTAFRDICAGRCRVVEHVMLSCAVIRDGAVRSHSLCLNEVAVLGGPPYSILEIDLYVDGGLVTTYSCDGLIVSTPVGSTAHSLSAGGPILRKNLQAVVISPISPHTLTVRPVVDSSERLYEMAVRHPLPATSVVVDGGHLQVLQSDDRVSVRRAKPNFKLIEVSGHTYYRTLREKLGWSGRLRQIDKD